MEQFVFPVLLLNITRVLCFFLSFQLVPILAESLLAPLTIPFGLCVLSNVRRDKVQIERMSAMREILLAS